MAAKTDTKPHYATRDFTDAGTTRRFEFAEELKDIEPGVLANYLAAGIASHEKPKRGAEAEVAVLDTVLG